MKKEDIVTIFFFGLVAVIFLQLLKVFAPFFALFLIGTVLAITFFPLHSWLIKRIRRFPNLCALLSTGCVTILVIAPVFLWAYLLTREAVDYYAVLRKFLRELDLVAVQQGLQTLPFPAGIREAIGRLDLSQPEPARIIFRTVDTASRFFVSQLASLTRNLFVFVFHVIFTILIIFFLLRNGESWYRFLYELIPMTEKNKKFLSSRLYHAVNAVVRGVFLTAAIQGVIAGFTLWLLQIPFALVWGFLTTVLALIPVIGAAGVWFPITIYLFVSQMWQKAIILALVGFFGISLADNLLRPLLIGERTKLPFLFLFLGIMGGFLAYGSVGILIGPLLIAIFLALVEIYREQYH